MEDCKDDCFEKNSCPKSGSLSPGESASLLSKTDVVIELLSEGTKEKDQEPIIENVTDEENGNVIYRSVVNVILCIHKWTATFCAKKTGPGRKLFNILLLIFYFVYLGFAFSHKFGDENSIILLIVTVLVFGAWGYSEVRKRFGKRIYLCCCSRIVAFIRRNTIWIRRTVYILVCAFVVFYIVADVIIERPRHLISIVGIIIYLFLVFFFSRSPEKVKWLPIISGLVLQFVLAVLILRTSCGSRLFDWIAARAGDLINIANFGSVFVFGPVTKDHFIIFKVLPVVIFFSSCVTIMRYLGLMQIVTDPLAFVMNKTVGASVTESKHSALNVFIGWAEATMYLRGKIDKMKVSEIHTVITSSFAVISGGNLAVFYLYGIHLKHLIAASFITAPAALAISKLNWPDDNINEEENDEIRDKEAKQSNVGFIDAAISGAGGVIAVVSHLVACLVAFVALMGLFDAIFTWLGDRIGLEMMSLQVMCSYLFWPFVYLMGVRSEDCHVSARVLGIKLGINELVAFSDLGVIINNRAELDAYNGTWHWTGNGDIVLDNLNKTLIGGVMSSHSEMITTYAICGFSDFLSYGILIVCFTTMAPSRKKDIIAAVNRGICGGIIAGFLTASMAGMIGEE